MTKVALVCDWLTTVGGAEVVLRALHEMYPSAPIYTSQYDTKGIDWFKDADVRTGWLQHLPSKLRRFYPFLRQHYFSHLDLSEYDLIISVTGAEAKFIKKGTATHLCYCHVPTQYYWQFYDEYLKHPGFGVLDPLARLALKTFIKPLRKNDYAAAQRPDHFITISDYAARQIKRYYNREATVIHPPVNVEKFHSPVEKNTIKIGKSQESKKGNNKIKNEKSQVTKSEQVKSYNTIKSSKNQALTPAQPVEKSGFINYSRQVTWKRLDLVVKACIATHRPLTLIGDGPEHQNLVKLAKGSPLITFLPSMPQSDLLQYLRRSEAFIFPSLEPFGIAPVEALAAGVPVIAYKGGGALDFIKNGKNGLFFGTQSPRSLINAIKKFEHAPRLLPPEKIATTADSFAAPEFKRKMQDFINEKVN